MSLSALIGSNLRKERIPPDGGAKVTIRPDRSSQIRCRSKARLAPRRQDVFKTARHFRWKAHPWSNLTARRAALSTSFKSKDAWLEAFQAPRSLRRLRCSLAALRSGTRDDIDHDEARRERRGGVSRIRVIRHEAAPQSDSDQHHRRMRPENLDRGSAEAKAKALATEQDRLDLSRGRPT